jgi:hypothetical protein
MAIQTSRDAADRIVPGAGRMQGEDTLPAVSLKPSFSSVPSGYENRLTG